MANVQVPTPWSRAGGELSESAYRSRREVLRALGLGGAMLASPALACARSQAPNAPSPFFAAPRSDLSYPASARWVPRWDPFGGRELYPAARNAAFTVDRALTPEDAAAEHNNYYEFLPDGAGPVHRYVAKFEARPWQLEIAGEVESPRVVELDDVAKIAALEERLYRFRCVERWSMVVPWLGLPLASFVAWCKPKASARYLRFVSFHRPDQAPGQKKAAHYDWPYYEGLRLDEALHPLALLVLGIYGHALPVQHGAPVRAIVPWKYGYKSPKGIAKVEFLTEEPPTFWNDVAPDEYGFLSNVDPAVPHPRWSQEIEWDVATGEKFPTRPYNGYADDVAKLYAG
jgi:sulfoxide reductase catalytic subunit YedY